jgi:hypothetical protein
MNKLKLTVTASIENGKIKYKSDKSEEKINKFKDDNNFKEVEISFEIIDHPQYYQHKYFHGYVLQQIAMGQGESNLDVVCESLKQEYLFVEIDSMKDIPSKHIGKCRTISERVIDANGEVKLRFLGYVPSRSTLTFKEYKDFIIKCEEIRDGLIDWMIPLEELDEMRIIREKAMNEKHS